MMNVGGFSPDESEDEDEVQEEESGDEEEPAQPESNLSDGEEDVVVIEDMEHIQGSSSEGYQGPYPCLLRRNTRIKM